MQRVENLTTKVKYRKYNMAYQTKINNLKDKKDLILKNMNLAEEDAKSLAQALKGTQIAILDLSKNNIKVEGVKYLAQALNETQITNLNLHQNNIRDEGVKYLAEVLKDTQITKLDLSKNNIRVEGAKFLAQALKDTQITSINLSNNNIGNEGVKCLAQTLKDTLITSLNLRENSIKDEGAKYLAQALKDTTQIIKFDLSENNIGVDGAQILNNTKIYVHDLDIHYTEDDYNQYISQYLIADHIYISLYGNKIGTKAAKYLNKIFQNIPIAVLTLESDTLEADDAQYLAQAFKDIKILKLNLRGNHICFNINYLIQAFKKSSIAELNVLAKKICSSGAKYLAEFLKEIKVIDLVLRLNYIGDNGLKYLAPAIKNNTIISLDLGWNDIKADGIKYLAEILNNTQITYLNLCNNSIGVNGAKYLANGLKYSQVTGIHLHGNRIENEGYKYLLDVVDDTNILSINLNGNNIEEKNNFYPFSLPRNTSTIVYEISNLFAKLVSLNPLSNEFDFIVPEKPYYSICVDNYAFLIKTLKQTPQVKVHIFDKMCRNDHNTFNLTIMQKINEFITVISNKFNTFINNELSALVELFENYNYVKLVKQFEDMKSHDIVQNLLLHRELYYIDESQEILHPYIYKMLNKYNMILYNEQLEPNKKEEITTYYQNHPEIDGVQEIIDLLGSETFQ